MLEPLAPGVVARLAALGGEFLALPHLPVPSKDAAGHTNSISFSFAYRLPTQRVRINLKMAFARQGTVWSLTYCSYHCGPSDDTAATHFRICWNSHHPFHFHLRGYESYGDRGHIAAEKADPPITKDALDFLALVEKFLPDKRKLPLQVKP